MLRRVALSIIFALFSTNVFAATYYVSTSGNNASTGTSEGAAWATVQYVSTLTNDPDDDPYSHSLQPGDSVLFKRGDIFIGVSERPWSSASGAEDSYINWGDYGEGDKPKMVVALKSNSTSDWYQCSTNVTPSTGCGTTNTNVWRYQNNAFKTIDCANLYFGAMSSSQTYGVKKRAYTELDAQGDFWFDTTGGAGSLTGNILLYSTTNPGNDTVYLSAGNSGFEIQNQSWLYFYNLDIWYPGGNGIHTNTVDHIIFEQVDVHWIGGADTGQNSPYDFGHSRYGDAISLGDTNTYVAVANSTFYQAFEVGASIEGHASDSVQTQIYIYYNTFDHVETGLVWTNDDADASSHDVYFEGNIITNLGDCWKTANIADEQAWENDDLSYGIWMWNSSITDYSDISFTYNTFSGGKIFTGTHPSGITNKGSGFSAYYNANGIEKALRDYNTYNIYTSESTTFGYIKDVATYANTPTGVAAWKAATCSAGLCQDVNSVFNYTNPVVTEYNKFKLNKIKLNNIGLK